MMQDAAPPPADAPVPVPDTALQAPAPAAAAPQMLMGLAATGPKKALDALQVAATDVPWPCRQVQGPKGPQLLIVFPPGTSQPAAQDFVTRVQGDKAFAKLKLSPLYAPSAG